MIALVTLQLFSGRPDPQWSLTESQESEFTRLVSAAPSAQAVVPPEQGSLGYRGLHVHIDRPGHPPIDISVSRGWIVGGNHARLDPGRKIERWLFGTGRATLPPDVVSYVEGEIP